MNHANPSRRKLIESLTLAAVALATLPVRRAARAAAPAAVSPPTPPGHANAAAAAPGLPHLTEDDPAAQTLAYEEDAARAGKIPGFVAGSPATTACSCRAAPAIPSDLALCSRASS